MRRRSAVIWSWLASDIDRQSVLFVVALWCIGYGLWPVIGRTALVVPGLVVLWVVLPARLPFVARPIEKRKGD